MLVLSCIVSLCTGCSVPGMAVALDLPVLPDRYPVDSWIVRWWDGAETREKTVRAENRIGQGPVRLALDSRGASLVAVSLIALTGPGGDLPIAPLGGWTDEPGTPIVPDRHGGELAEVLLMVARGGLDPGLVNVPRLEALIRSRVARNPRRLDRSRLAAALAEREMRSYHAAERRVTLHQVRLLLADGVEDGTDGADGTDAENELDGHRGAWTGDDSAEDRYVPAPAGAYELFSVPVIPGEVRRLWRRCPDGTCYQLLMVYSTPEGNTYHTIREVVIAPQN